MKAQSSLQMDLPGILSAPRPIFRPTVPIQTQTSPTAPYIVKSGERQGKSLEKLMFDDYRCLIWQLQKLNMGLNGNGKNGYHSHLEWLIRQGETRQSPVTCPICGKNKIKFFSVRYSNFGDFSIGRDYTCCENKECHDRIEAMSLEKMPDILPLKFSALSRFSKRNVKHVANNFRIFFDLTKKFSDLEAFQFFR